MYFDKYEKELGAVIEPTTNEYEAEAQAASEEDAAAMDADVDVEPGIAAEQPLQ